MLELIDICKRFGQRCVAERLSLTVAAGETLALLGPSGCGKSTLLKIIAGLEQPDAGRVRFAGTDITATAPEAREFALMFQDFALFPHLDVSGNVGFGLVERRVKRAEVRERVEAALAQVGLAGYGARRVFTLSGGEQQRVALARALVTRPRLMLLDEPFSSLDANLRQNLQQVFRRLLTDAGIPAILVTHDRAEAFALADRVALLRDGRIVQQATPAELLARPADAWVARFIGYDNVLGGALVPEQAFCFGDAQPLRRVEALETLAEGVRLTVAFEQGPLRLTLSPREAAGLGEGLRVGGKVRVGIDPARMIPLPA
ncbi:ABC transporter ATP-binding protein [Crenobacter sp. SG2305]|uniref:ABC transporter ATP-binding protein n=1 Tax=Crenobacter oryzisoli TaxID=3056844 RepID=UPI0025AA76BE|nr:ABC transporter ATP-binding protein [Crenobacter sp. SG2305]MDN0084057.1 ABC transporter ATP-binding protein [Crenobacter sp. SG2305]